MTVKGNAEKPFEKKTQHPFIHLKKKRRSETIFVTHSVSVDVGMT